MNFILAVVIGVGTGILSGFGIGGGTLLVLFLTLFAGAGQQMAQGINLLYFMACAPPSLFSHIKNKLVRLKPALFASGAGLLTSAASSLLAVNMDDSLLRQAFGILLLYVGVKELFSKKKENEEKPVDKKKA